MLKRLAKRNSVELAWAKKHTENQERLVELKASPPLSSVAPTFLIKKILFNDTHFDGVQTKAADKNELQSEPLVKKLLNSAYS